MSARSSATRLQSGSAKSAGSRSSAASSSRRTGAARARRERARRRRRIALLVLAVVVGGTVVLAIDRIASVADRAVQEVVTLPLRHDDIIRQQASDKDLDPALIAGVIYTESRFRDVTSSAGAKGLMQLMPDTAEYIAERSGGIAFTQADLATPQVNIAYGAWYLRFLLDHYGGEEVLALAAYNAGLNNIDRWVAEARSRGETFDVASHVPFPETRAYVRKVLGAREDYAREYADELGL